MELPRPSAHDPQLPKINVPEHGVHLDLNKYIRNKAAKRYIFGLLSSHNPPGKGINLRQVLHAHTQTHTHITDRSFSIEIQHPTICRANGSTSNR